MIYFAQSENGFIKIGYTRKSARGRINTLKSALSEKIILLATMSGSLETERALHKKFADYCVGGEWFSPDQSLLVFIEENSTKESDCVEFHDADVLEKDVAKSIKRLRLLKNLTRQDLCKLANVSENALRHLEGGASGASVRTLVRVVKALNRQDWISNLAPVISVNPLDMVKGKPRRRARSKKS